MTENDEILAIPLWINGHAYLTMTPTFFDVRDRCTGQIKRRTPLCGTDQALTAVASAQAALPAWAALTIAARAMLLAALAAALAAYAEHFANLIAEETGKNAASASAEVEQALRVLKAAGTGSVATGGSGVVAVVCDDQAPLLGPLRLAVQALLAGATVVIKPSPKAPSAAFALAELTARNGFPGGVVNILHGDLAAIEGLCTASAVGLLLFAGDPALGSKVAAIASRHGKPFVD
ncbi:aldehyde dehydrogenase family protein [Accumulibacter sp.]|uniref:aldehyde dehydrogenase family protein n=1 Tax=Accumulibacter sp. TaxID=2053492 RepID=UPI002B98A808|nr:aldehyde dehydrogenase family protein [Accumulibacter sp.]HMW54597.1 aldehyde dehydrogenase family protein [Accumulibacter sp.]HNC20106.1 aldehyde dehydrogenase family protein [Accumulibacter sp.]